MLITFGTGVFSVVTIVGCPTTTGTTPQVGLWSIASHIIQKNRPSSLTIPRPLRGSSCTIVAQLTTDNVRISQSPAVVADRTPAIRGMVNLNSSFVSVPWANQPYIRDGVTYSRNEDVMSTGTSIGQWEKIPYAPSHNISQSALLNWLKWHEKLR